MAKQGDYGRTWELTTTSDDLTYTLEYGGWSNLGITEVHVYRCLTQTSRPLNVDGNKQYLVDPAEYVCDSSAGTVTFHQAQPLTDHVYVTLVYPYLRESQEGNRLCSDCHDQKTHMGENCLACHTAHRTTNIMLVRDEIDAFGSQKTGVEFRSYTGAKATFSNVTGSAYGPCEVCHTQTLYHNRDRSGQPHYDGEDCTGCHPHSYGFPK